MIEAHVHVSGVDSKQARFKIDFEVQYGRFVVPVLPPACDFLADNAA